MKIKSFLKRLLGYEDRYFNSFILNDLKIVKDEARKINLHVGELHARLNKLCSNSLSNIQEYEFQVFSQWGDDGIIQFLVNYVDVENKSFVEFGVESYKEANTRFLLIYNNWRGLVMDGSKSNMDTLKKEEIFWKYDLTACNAFITKENINSLLKQNGFTGNIGLLHIDIDGNDYWIWKEISVINPEIVIMEYNSLFGVEKAWTIPYDKNFVRTRAHFSNLYFGASLLALCDLASEKGYSFVGTNSNGNNAYFVRNDKLKKLKVLSPKEGFVNSRFSEGRNENGELNYIRGDKRINIIKGLPVFNTRTGDIEKI